MTKASIASLDANLSRDVFDIRIFVVDNNSDDGSLEILNRAFSTRDDVEVIPSTENRGYGAGNNLVLNQVIASQEYEFVWLLNPDTVLLNDIPGQIMEFLMRPMTAAVGARLEDPDTTPQVSAFRFPSFVSEFLHSARIGFLDRLFGRWRVVQPISDIPTRVDWLAGASVFLKVEALREVGVFDEDYFLYFEEVDLFKRMAAHGWEFWYVPSLRMIHHVGASTGISDYRRKPSELPDYWYESRSHYFKKQHGSVSALGIDLSWLWGRWIYLFLSLLLRRKDSSAVKASRIIRFTPLLRKALSANVHLEMNNEREVTRFSISTRQALWSRVRQSWIAHGRKFSSPGFKAVAVHGFGQWRQSIRSRWLRAPFSVLYRILYRRCCTKYGIELPCGVSLGERVIFEHQNYIVIHGDSVIGDDSIIRHGVTLGNRYLDLPNEAPTLGKRVNVGTGAVILGKVTLGDDVQVGANAVVLTDVSKGSTVVGAKSKILEEPSPPR